MSTAYLIDGYNLLHALGFLAGRAGPHGLEAARDRLLAFLKVALGEEGAAVTVIFDAATGPPGAAAEQDYRGLRVRFAVGHASADDLIENLIRAAPDPRALHVVSDDHRVQRAARRRNCQALACGDYLDQLAARRPRRRAAEPPEKQGNLSDGETQKWLAEFGNLAEEPGWKELFDAYPFEDE